MPNVRDHDYSLYFRIQGQLYIVYKQYGTISRCDLIHSLRNLITNLFSKLNFKLGSSICMGGYENNPILLDKIPNDFHFGLYELDYSVFDAHIEGAVKLCPTFGNAGIKSTICGPESFTPDHKPLMVNERFPSFRHMSNLDWHWFVCLTAGSRSTSFRSVPQLWIQLCRNDAGRGMCETISKLDYSRPPGSSHVCLWHQTIHTKAEESLRLGGWEKSWKLR